MKDLNERGLENQVKGTVKEMKGKIRGDLGDATDNSSEHIKGRTEELKGKVQKNFGKGERKADPDNINPDLEGIERKSAGADLCTGAFLVFRRCNSLVRRSSRWRNWRASSRVSASTLSELTARGRAHPVELHLLVGIQQPLDLRVSTVADYPRQDRDRIELRLYRLVERDDLPVLLLDQRINGCLLTGSELELFGHSLSVRARAPHIAAMLGVHHPVGGETQRAARDESAEQKHHGVTL